MTSHATHDTVSAIMWKLVMLVSSGVATKMPICLLLLCLVAWHGHGADQNTFVITNFDNGATKVNIETITDFHEVPSGQFQLLYGDVFSDNFNGETNGTAPPASWINAELDLLDVNGAQYASGDRSMKAIGDGRARHQMTITNQRVTIYFRPAQDTCRFYIDLPTTSGGGGVANSTACMQFYKWPNGVYYFTAGGTSVRAYVGAYVRYNVNAWNKLEYQLYPDTDRWSGWLNDVQICSNVTAWVGAFTSAKCIEFWHGTDGSIINWYDDIKVGDYCDTGNWLSSTQFMGLSLSVDTTAIYHTIPTNTAIDRIEWLVDGQVRATYEPDITNGASTLITREMPTGGAFSDVNDDFQVKVYLKGDGSSTPAVTKIEGTTAMAGTMFTVR